MSPEYITSFARDASVEFDLTMTDTDGLEQFRAVKVPREWTVHLAEGQKWPDNCKRGRKVDFEIGFDGEVRRFVGTVKYRRLNKLVLVTDE